MNGDICITVALLTRNRPHYLRQAIDSILAQEHVDLELLVLDNASTDETSEVVRSCKDPRVLNLRSEVNIGMTRNWNRGIEIAASRSPYACIFHDDDVMLPGFLAESTRLLDAHPSAGFSFCLPQFVSASGELLDCEVPNDVRIGLINGREFLELAIDRRTCGIYPPCVVFRSESLMRVGPVDSPHVGATMDLNLYYRLARNSDVCFIRKVLAHCRRHNDSETDRVSRTAGSMIRYGVVAELIDIVGYLLQTERAADPRYRDWLAERLHSLHAEQSEEIRKLAPSAYYNWNERRDLLIEQIEVSIPQEQSLILIDDDQLALCGRVNGRRALPLIEQNGEYFGEPNDAEHAIGELERLRATGIRWLVVAWTSMWYLEIYADLRRHLRDKYEMSSRTPHGCIFDLAD